MKKNTNCMQTIYACFIGYIVQATTDEDMRSGKFTFKADGGLIWEDDEISSDCSYTLNDDKLKIILNHDDYIEGTISISGNQATYKYTWHDYAGECPH